MTASRLPAPLGTRLDRSRSLSFEFNGRILSGHPGDTLASALLANGVDLVGRSFKLSRAQQFWKILLPSALPSIFVGLRLGLIFALINVVGIEFLINFGGLGQLINDLAERYDLPAMYATIGFVILVSVVFFMSLERIERWLRPGQ